MKRYYTFPKPPIGQRRQVIYVELDILREPPPSSYRSAPTRPNLSLVINR